MRFWFFFAGLAAMSVALARPAFAVPTLIPAIGALGLFLTKIFFLVLSLIFFILAAVKKNPLIYVAVAFSALAAAITLYFFYF